MTTFREYLRIINEVKDEDLSYIESFIREEFPSGSKLRYNKTKSDTVYITWGKINESRIAPHAKLGRTNKGSVFIDDEMIVDKYETGYDFYKILVLLNKKLKNNYADSINNICITFDTVDTTDNKMHNVLFRIGDFK